MNPPRSEPESDQIERGLRCRKCGCGHFRVVYTRRAVGGRIVRRRECRHCATRLTTCEKIVATPRDS